MKTVETKGFFSIWNHHNFLSQLFPIHLHTYAMAIKNSFTFTVRESILAVRIWRLQTSDSDD